MNYHVQHLKLLDAIQILFHYKLIRDNNQFEDFL